MAHQRTPSTSEGLKGPHTVSLKVLRLSRPSLTYQHPLPQPSASNPLPVPPKASRSYPFDDTDDSFIVSPLLTLPPAFGSAYVGETFACTLCANNELPASDDTRRVGGVRMAAEMQTPLNPAGAVLELGGAGGDEKAALERDEPLQRIVRFELKEEGTHILAVTVTYTETQRGGEGQASSGRVRTFRKLYQFVAQTLLSVRTKAGELPSRAGGSRYALEAQLENLGDNAVSLEAVSITPKPPFRSISLNWDLHSENSETPHSLILNPRDVTQVAFLLEPRDNGVVEQEGTRRGQVADSRIVLGQLCFQWRSAMGDRGSLKTGWLTSRKR